MDVCVAWDGGQQRGSGKPSRPLRGGWSGTKSWVKGDSQPLPATEEAMGVRGRRQTEPVDQAAMRLPFSGDA